MKKIAVALFGAFAGLSMTAGAMAADSFTIDSRHTYPVFEVNHLGFSTQRGRFNNVSGKIMLVPAQNSGSIEVTIDSASVDMGLEAWDKHMRGEDFFNVEKFPNMTFKSTKLLYEGDKLVGAEGDFTLLGVTKPVKLEVKGFTCGTHPINKKALCGADISTTIKRSEFGMTKYVPSISDDVVIKIPVEAFKD
jgi:polyisoprenoid-binding protein YceI